MLPTENVMAGPQGEALASYIQAKQAASPIRTFRNMNHTQPPPRTAATQPESALGFQPRNRDAWRVLGRLITLTLILLLPQINQGLNGFFQRISTSASERDRRASQIPAPLHVAGNQLLNSVNRPVLLRGANRSGTEYACINGPRVSDGPSDVQSLQAMRAWGLNAVRVPLNEDCWLGINGVAIGGAVYRIEVKRFVLRILAAKMYPIIDLHISAPGGRKAVSQQSMPDEDHALAFWRSVGRTFGHNDAVIFDLFNEPFPLHNAGSIAAWQCWRNGCVETAEGSLPYRAAGMQSLVNAVRSSGATNVLMLGGVQFSNSLSNWLSFLPKDPLSNLVASQHFYNYSGCDDLACWNTTTARVAARLPVIAGEVGDTDCTISNTARILQFFEQHRISYLAWNWGTNFGCQSLIQGYDGTPTQPYGQWFHDWVLHAIGANIRARPLSTYFNNVGVVADGRQVTCGFDDQSYCYSNNALDSSGLSFGASILFNHSRFSWHTQAGMKDNVVAAGQTVTISPILPGATVLNIIGAATHGPARGTLLLRYSDGTTKSAPVDFSDWTLLRDNAPVEPEPGNTILAKTTFRDKSDGTTQRFATYIYGISIPIDKTRTLVSVRLPILPQAINSPQLHIFALQTARA
ncbi:MAG: cellulose-binding family [Chloroflexi bacterium]|nr:cellulose-binding family [Chloroflexota bacterium]